MLYISGEESGKQIKLRANRMGTFSEHLYLLCETNLELIRQTIERQKPDMVVIDSIQTMYNEEVSSAPGSVSQVRESTNMTDAAGKRDEYLHFYCGTCDERRNSGRSQGTGTHGGYRPLLRR